MKSILRLSEASNLAIHALAFIATLGPNRPVSAAKIASDINVSESHLSKVLQNLARDGFISSIRGAKGGFFFDHDPGDISFLDVLVAVDGPLPEPACLLDKPVCSGPKCKLHDLMLKTNEFITKELSGVKLKNFVIRPAEKQKSAAGQ